MYYDALGRVTKTVNPDNSEQKVVFGIPDALDTPDTYTPTPWERYHYSPNDLAGVTNPGSGVPQSSWWTPKSETIDPLGNVIKTTEHKAHYDPAADAYQDVVMRYVFDVKGQLTRSTDPYDRPISQHTYGTAGQVLRTIHIDRGEQTLVADALNLPVITNDAKGARTLFTYDVLQRPSFVWARDNGGEAITKRQVLRYGDSDGPPNPENKNLKGKLYAEYDGAGRVMYPSYGFKGHPLQKVRKVLKDDLLSGTGIFVPDWDVLSAADMAKENYATDTVYDALGRPMETTYPPDTSGGRKKLQLIYNKSGALESVKFAGANAVQRIAYNAKGQRILMVAGGLMTRYAYHPETFRLARLRAEKFTKTGLDYAGVGGIRLDRAYGYDLEGSVTDESDRTPADAASRGPGNLDRTFAHDPMRRLISATGRESTGALPLPPWDLNTRPEDPTATNTYTRNYAYDKLGNILSLQHLADGHPGNNFTRNFTYDPGQADNRLTGFTVGSNAYSYHYDQTGNVIAENTDRHFAWNHADKLAFFKRQAGGGSPSLWAHYLYDGEGNRVKKVVNKAGGIQEVAVYIDGLFAHCYTKQNGSVDNTRHYTNLNVVDGTSRIATLRTGNDADDPTPAQKLYVEDHLGSCSVVVTASGNRINLEEFYPFGETSFGSYAKKRFRYNGKEKDEESGLYEYGQRYYAPWLCRFVSVDPVAEEFADLSAYNYAGNRPISKRDQEGLQEEGRQGTPKGGGGNINLSDSLQTLEQRGKSGAKPTTLEVHGNPPLELTPLGLHDGANSNQPTDSPKNLNVVESGKVKVPEGMEVFFSKGDITKKIHELPAVVISSGQQSVTPLGEIISKGIEESPTFANLAEANGITTETYFFTVFYKPNVERSGTYPNGQIVLKPSTDPKQVIIEFTHEMSNRLYLSEVQENLASLKNGGKTPEEYAQFLVDMEFLGQKNQIKVAADIGYRFDSSIEGAPELNGIIDRVAAGESVNLISILNANPERFDKYVRNAREILRNK